MSSRAAGRADGLTRGAGLGVVVVALALPALEQQAEACTVTVGDRIDLQQGGENTCVRMGWDRVADLPAVMWIDNATGTLTFRKHLGPNDDQWEPPVVVDTGAAQPPTQVTDDYPRLWRMFALAFDGAGEPHVVFTGEVTAGDTKLYYVHRIGSAWSAPEELVDLPDLLNAQGWATYEPWVEADFDSTGRLHVVYHCYGGGDAEPECNHRIRALYRDQGVWQGPQLVIEPAAGMDMSIGPDDVVHVVTVQGGGNQHQAFYNSSSPGGETWPPAETKITSEPPGFCYAGPVSCWPSIATSRDGHPYMAYGVDPDPCCVPPPQGPAPCDWPDAPNPPEPEWVPAGGFVKLVHDSGAGWTDDSPVEVLQDIALHGSLPEIVIDPIGVRYVFGPNFHREVAYAPQGGPWTTVGYETDGGGRWLFLHALATGDGAWIAYPRPPTGQPTETVTVRHLSRSGSCATGTVCSSGQTRACGNCGTQSCGADGQWASCAGQGECYPEATKPCEGQTATCTFECQWDMACGGSGVGGAAGAGGSNDGGGGSGGTTAAGGAPAAPPDDDSGCSCRLADRERHGGPWHVLGLLSAALAAAARLRRRAW